MNMNMECEFFWWWFVVVGGGGWWFFRQTHQPFYIELFSIFGSDEFPQ